MPYRLAVMNRAYILKRALMTLLIVLLVVTAVLLLKGYREGHFRSVETLRTFLKTFGIFAPLVLTVIQALQVVIPILPGFLGCIVGAVSFGPNIGFWCNYIGISAGSIIAYFLARRYGMALVKTMIRMEKYSKLIDWVNTKKSYTVVFFLAILLPLAPDDFFCYFSGLAGMSRKKFVTIILIAKPWCILFYSVFFAYFL